MHNPFAKPDDKRPAGPTPEVIADGSHARTTRIGAIVNAELKTETVSETESRILLDELAGVCREADLCRLVIDMQHVTVLTSAGIGLLVTLHKRLTSVGGALAIYGLSDDITHLMKLTRMDRLFPIAADRAAAIKAVS